MPSQNENRPRSTSAKSQPKRRRVPKGGPTKADLRRFKEVLLRLRANILRSSQKLADEALKSSGQDFSVDHMADHGTDNFDQDFSLALLEGETELFRDIQDALDKIDGRADLPYGMCENCADEQPPDGSPQRCATCPWIPNGRLEAVPYARLCVTQKEIEEEGGA